MRMVFCVWIWIGSRRMKETLKKKNVGDGGGQKGQNRFCLCPSNWRKIRRVRCMIDRSGSGWNILFAVETCWGSDWVMPTEFRHVKNTAHSVLSFNSTSIIQISHFKPLSIIYQTYLSHHVNTQWNCMVEE